MIEITIRKDVLRSVVNRVKSVSKIGTIQIEYDGKNLSFLYSEQGQRVKSVLLIDGLVATSDSKEKFKRGLEGIKLLNSIDAIIGEDVKLIYNPEKKQFTLQGNKKKNIIDLTTFESRLEDLSVIDQDGENEVQIKLGEVQLFEEIYTHFDRVRNAASKKDSSPLLNAVRVRLREECILFQATDGHRVYQHQYTCEPKKFVAMDGNGTKKISDYGKEDQEKIMEKEFLVSTLSLEKAKSVFEKKDPTALFISDRLLTLTSKQKETGVITTYTSSLLTGKYPDVDKIIRIAESEKKFEARVKKEELVRIIESIKSVLSGGKTYVTHFRLSFTKDSTEVLVSLKDSTISFQDTMELEAPFSSDMNVSLNVKYLAEMQRYFEDVITLSLISPIRPIMVECNKNQPVNLVVPVRAN